MLTVEFLESATRNIEIFNMIGEKIYSVSGVGNSKNSIDLSSIQNGIYLLQLKSAKETITKKIILSK